MRPLFANVFDIGIVTYFIITCLICALLQIVLNGEHLPIELSLMIVFNGLLGVFGLLVLDGSRPEELTKVGVIKLAYSELTNAFE